MGQGEVQIEPKGKEGGERMINRKSWRIVEIVLMRYPEKKREYEEYISDVMSSTGGNENLRPDEEDNKPQSVTEAKALKLSSVYADRAKREIEAVEFVYRNLKQEEQKVIRQRYWNKTRKPVPYEMLPECSYSARQMKRIVRKTILQVGRYIGEIK